MNDAGKNAEWDGRPLSARVGHADVVRARTSTVPKMPTTPRVAGEKASAVSWVSMTSAVVSSAGKDAGRGGRS